MDIFYFFSIIFAICPKFSIRLFIIRTKIWVSNYIFLLENQKITLKFIHCFIL
jgi:hypothetical protein